MDNNTLRSRQLNPCDDLFWKSRGYPRRPQNWRQILEDIGYYDNSSEENSDEYESGTEIYDDTDDEDEDSDYEDTDEKSNRNNPNNDEYWKHIGWSGRPDNWREILNGKLPQKKPQQPEHKNSSCSCSLNKRCKTWWTHGPNLI